MNQEANQANIRNMTGKQNKLDSEKTTYVFNTSMYSFLTW